MRIRTTVTACLAVLATGAMALGQVRDPARPTAPVQPRQPGQAVQPAQPGQPVHPGATSPVSLQAHIADCLMLHHQEEVAISEFALDRIKDSKVKQFAEMLIEDHKQAAEKLRPFASHGKTYELRAPAARGAARPDAAASDNPARPGTAAPDTTVRPRPAPGSAPAVVQPGVQIGVQPGIQIGVQPRVQPDVQVGVQPGVQPGTRRDDVADRLFAIQHDAAMNCLALTQECLSKQSGSDFDQAFLGFQVGMHIGAEAKLKAVQDHVSGEFAEVVRTQLQTVRKHREQAERLMETLGKTSTAGTERNRTN